VLKRLAAAASVTVLAVVGLAPTASAATPNHRHVKIVKAIDWDAPPAHTSGTIKILRSIDWD
jgi:hypothetical protein